MENLIFLTLILVVLMLALATAIVCLRPQPGNSPAADSYQQLLRKAFGDQALVERLIEGERKRQPEASRDKLMRYVLERWERHLR